MAKQTLNIDLRVTELDKVKSLITLIDRFKDELPAELLLAKLELSGDGISESSSDCLIKMEIIVNKDFDEKKINEIKCDWERKSRANSRFAAATAICGINGHHY